MAMFPDVNADMLGDNPVTIIGIGTLGRPLALKLCAWGVKSFILWDDDIVEDRNVFSRNAQGYLLHHIGMPKVTALESQLRAINPNVQVVAHQKRFARDDQLNGYVFACVDKMESRVDVRDTCFEHDDRVHLLVEGRINDTGGKVFCLKPKNVEHRAQYSDAALWYTSEEADQGGCGHPRMNPLSAQVCTGIMFQGLQVYLRLLAGADHPFINSTLFDVEPAIVTVHESWC